ncbi:MAG TPA: sigma 54-interacting transcriptional regulator, partial [Polyangiaceae bacterium]|nr:sigma 54-interacting transcriptional regulator [Polyangiaceae bacterium]
FVDGVRVHGTVSMPSLRVVRIAETVLVPCENVDAIESPLVRDDGWVMGSRLRQVLAVIEREARTSSTLLIRGETGTGKEQAARAFHAFGPHAKGPFVAVNCAAIPEGLAERLLFGAKRGAYSGASTDAVGHLQNADGGVLFLDEGVELDLSVQAKLLRVLETQEVIPLGASHGVRVQVRVCIATHGDLRAAVAEGRFRADLYHRIAPPEVVLPPLRDRLDEIAHHVTAEIAGIGLAEAETGLERLTAHAALVETCLVRAWPGNVRELRKEVRHAASVARAKKSDRVRLDCLSPNAGHPFEGEPRSRTPSPAAPSLAAGSTAIATDTSGQRRGYKKWSKSISRAELERALAENAGNVAIAARSLGMQRTQMYREMTRWSVKRPTRG